jgi:hypothetical protein
LPIPSSSCRVRSAQDLQAIAGRLAPVDDVLVGLGEVARVAEHREHRLRRAQIRVLLVVVADVREGRAGARDHALVQVEVRGKLVLGLLHVGLAAVAIVAVVAVCGLAGVAVVGFARVALAVLARSVRDAGRVTFHRLAEAPAAATIHHTSEGKGRNAGDGQGSREGSRSSHVPFLPRLRPRP